MRTLGGRLSRLAQVRLGDKSALVYIEETGACTLERDKKEPLGLGDSRYEAELALHTLGVAAARSRSGR